MSNTSVAEESLQAEPVQTARQHIFAVDGAPECLNMVRALFEDERYNVTTTSIVPRTFEQIIFARPDLLIVDVVLGEIAVWELLEKLHREDATRSIPVILTSTNPKLPDWARTDINRWGNTRAIVKPFDVDDIIQTVLDLIGPA